ncbi:MAG: glutamine-hydrolyzing carbamoyl-phosphate synthase small subunit [Candidatus Sumerlaeales bacterium]|nr:glutamine-hydrolyzing carbamoyl-phosphate synthase small subunit [Candidatus Sumerlaeales bacterium]
MMVEQKNRWSWKEQRDKSSFLALEDGTVLRGQSIGASVDTLGEVVFNTGMTGYQEILTDPSYSGQLVTMTFPEQGNYGINREDGEQYKIFANGLLVHDAPPCSNWRASMSLSEYLCEQGIPSLAGIDTRALTIRLRDYGTMRAYLSVAGKRTPEAAVECARNWDGLNGQDYVCKVTTAAAYEWDADGRMSTSWGCFNAPLPATDMHIVAYDFGIKWNILRRLRQQRMRVTVVPAHTSAREVLALKPDGVFLSNGPADPSAVTYAVDAIRDLIGRVPLFGICLGHQLLGLAVGGKTRRIKFGHHGLNHPVKDLRTGKVEITSQNHNYVVDADSLSSDKAEVSHLNLNDGTVEGLRLLHAPGFSVQYHPEASPGPHDSMGLFDRFREMIEHS